MTQVIDYYLNQSTSRTYRPVISLLKRSVRWLNKNTGNACQIAAICINVVLYRSGQKTFSVTFTIILLMGYLERANLLPLRFRKWYSSTSDCVVLASGLFSNSWITKLYYIMSLVTISSKHLLIDGPLLMIRLNITIV